METNTQPECKSSAGAVILALIVGILLGIGLFFGYKYFMAEEKLPMIDSEGKKTSMVENLKASLVDTFEVDGEQIPMEMVDEFGSPVMPQEGEILLPATPENMPPMIIDEFGNSVPVENTPHPMLLEQQELELLIEEKPELILPSSGPDTKE